MSSNPRKVENVSEPLCQAGDSFVARVVEMQVLNLGPLHSGTENTVTAICVDTERMLAGFGSVAPDCLKNFQRPCGQGNIAGVVILGFGQVDDVAADVPVGNVSNFTGTHGRFNGEQKHRTGDLPFTDPRACGEVQRLSQLVNFILINPALAALAGWRTFDRRQRIYFDQLPFFMGNNENVFKQVHFTSYTRGLKFFASPVANAIKAGMPPLCHIGFSQVRYDVFTKWFALQKVMGKFIQANNFPALTFLIVRKLCDIAVKDLPHGVAAVGSAGNTNFKFTRPNLSLTLGFEGLGFADGLAVYAPRNLSLPTVGRFKNRRHAQNSNCVVTDLAMNGSRTSHDLPKLAQNKDKGKTMTEHGTIKDDCGAQKRTRVSFKINHLGVDDSSKIVIEKENAANLAGFNGAKTTCETSQFPDEFSPEWAGAPAIILRHFCGVAA